MQRTAAAAAAATASTAATRKKVLMLSESNVRDILLSSSWGGGVMNECLDANRKALAALASGRAQVPTRIGLPYQPPPPPPPPLHVHAHHHDNDPDPDHHHDHPTAAAPPPPPPEEQPGAPQATDWSLFKPAAYLDEDCAATLLTGIKVVSVRAGNAAHGLPMVPATVLLLDAPTGALEAVVSATHLTAARTAAGSALATDLALRNGQGNRESNWQHLVLFGAGLQAQWHVVALSTMLQRPIPRVTIVNRTESRAESLRQTLLGIDGGDEQQRRNDADDKQQQQQQQQQQQMWCDECDVVLLDDRLAVADALCTAGVVVTCTNTQTPLPLEFLPAGCHVNGVGSYTAQMQEVPARAVERCRVYVDTPEAKEVGDLLCLASGHPVTLLGQALLDDEKQGEEQQRGGEDEPSSPSPMLDCTFYKAVGTAIQDVLTADLVVRKAREMGLGTELDMS